MLKSHYDKQTGEYIDVTTGRSYPPPKKCEICGTTYGLSYHHYLSQNKCLNSLKSSKIKFPKDWTKEFIEKNQRLIPLCLQHHADVHSMSDDRFFEKYGRERKEFIYLD